MSDHFTGVRRAVENDEQSLLVLLRQAHHDNGIFDDMNDEKVVAGILQGTRGGGGIIGIIAGPNGIEASVGLYLEQLWYSDTWWFVDRWNFVREDCRRSTHAKRLIEWAKWCSDQTGIDLFMGVMSSKRTEAKVRLYRRQLPHMGAYFLYRANSGAAVALTDVKVA